MRTTFRSWIVRLAALLAVAVATAAPAAEGPPFRQEELDQVLAPVALYPDPLLFQVLAASTRPLEVVQAARWSRANPNLSGQDAVRALEGSGWDPSVRALAAFPQVLVSMDDNIGWTARLGQAWAAQPAEVMDTVQSLRRRAEAAGNLRSGPQAEIARQGDVIAIGPPAGVVYVPNVDPAVVYGPWPAPAYPPVYWAPPVYAAPVYRAPIAWSSGIVISASFISARPDWYRRRPVYSAPAHPVVVHPRPHYVAPRPAPVYVAPAPRAYVHVAPRPHVSTPAPRAHVSAPVSRPHVSAPAPRPHVSAAPPARTIAVPESRDRGVRVRRD